MSKPKLPHLTDRQMIAATIYWRYSQMDTQEIANEMGLSEAAVYNSIFAREKRNAAEKRQD